MDYNCMSCGGHLDRIASGEFECKHCESHYLLKPLDGGEDKVIRIDEEELRTEIEFLAKDVERISGRISRNRISIGAGWIVTFAAPLAFLAFLLWLGPKSIGEGTPEKFFSLVTWAFIVGAPIYIAIIEGKQWLGKKAVAIEEEKERALLKIRDHKRMLESKGE